MHCRRLCSSRHLPLTVSHGAVRVATNRAELVAAHAAQQPVEVEQSFARLEEAPRLAQMKDAVTLQIHSVRLSQ